MNHGRPRIRRRLLAGQPPDEAADISPSGGEFVNSGDPKILLGNAASRGVAHGKAKVVHGLDESEKLQAGDILVRRSTSPSWTPLIARSSAIVTEYGAVLSHSAIVAREFSIPCVVGVPGATTVIADGTTLLVDGGQGTVRIGD